MSVIDKLGQMVYNSHMPELQKTLFYEGGKRFQSFFQNGITKRPHKIQELFEKGKK